jgi:hypothetical protein
VVPIVESSIMVLCRLALQWPGLEIETSALMIDGGLRPSLGFGEVDHDGPLYLEHRLVVV